MGCSILFSFFLVRVIKSSLIRPGGRWSMTKISSMNAKTVRDDSPFGVQAGFRDFVQRFSRVVHHARVAPGLSQKLRCLRHKSFLRIFGPPAPFVAVWARILTSALQHPSPCVPFLLSSPSCLHLDRESQCLPSPSSCLRSICHSHFADVVPRTSPVPYVALAEPGLDPGSQEAGSFRELNFTTRNGTPQDYCRSVAA